MNSKCIDAEVNTPINLQSEHSYDSHKAASPFTLLTPPPNQSQQLVNCNNTYCPSLATARYTKKEMATGHDMHMVLCAGVGGVCNNHVIWARLLGV